MAQNDLDNGTLGTLDTWRPLSWSAILFGSMLALGVSAMLHLLGIGVAASAVDASGRSRDALVTLGGVTGVWFLVSTAISLFIGGFVASTLSRTFSNGRAAMYGLGVWALTTLVTSAAVVPALISGTGAALSSAGAVADRAVGAVANAGTTASQNAPEGFVDRIQRALVGNPEGSGPVDRTASQEIATLIIQRFTRGDWTPQQREQLNTAVARAANIPVDDARRRVDEAQTAITNTLRQTEDTMRQAADATRRGLAYAAYWAAAAMLIGMISALFGARYGELDDSDLPSFARMRMARVQMRRN